MQPDNPDVMRQVAGIYVKLKMDDKALALFGPAYAKKNDTDAPAMSSYAWFWSGQDKNLDGALAAAKRATELKPAQYNSWVTLSNVQAKMKNFADAIKSMEKAIELASESLKDYYKKALEKLKADATKK
jgi:tetratricopeptide (TPR) repeat protein